MKKGNRFLYFIAIETCNLCNRSCPWCLFGQLPNFRGKELKLLDTSYIKKVFLELKENSFSGIISMFDINEPLLDERIKDGSLIRLGREIFGNADIKLNVTTNGDLLTEEIINNLIDAGVDDLCVSCYDNVILEKSRRFQKDFPSIIILDYTSEKASELKLNRAGSIKSYTGYVPEKNKSCMLPTFSTVIGYDGEIRLCFNDAVGHIKFGNIKNESFYEIINSKKMTRLRNEICVDRRSIFPCNVCNFTCD